MIALGLQSPVDDVITLGIFSKRDSFHLKHAMYLTLCFLLVSLTVHCASIRVSFVLLH